jgi:hypothetical protein
MYKYNRRELKKTISTHVVVGGHDADPDPMQMGRVRTRDPLRHGPNVKNEHRPFVQILSPTGGMGQNEFNRPPRPGSSITIIREEDGYEYGLGIPHAVEKPGDRSISGNASFDQLIPELKQAADKVSQINIPPDINQQLENNRTGLKRLVKKVTEKNQLDKHKLYEGLQTHGAIFSLLGVHYKELTNISTALTPFSQLMNSGMLSQLSGAMPALGGLLNQVSSSLKNNLMSGLSSDMQGALNNLLNLLPSEYQLSSVGNFEFGGKVNGSTFASKAIDTLKGITNNSELVNAFNKIMSDDNIRDLASLATKTISLSGPFGEIIQTLLPNGQISMAESSVTRSLREAFGSLAKGIPAAGSTLFSQDSQMTTLLERLPEAAEVLKAKLNLETKDPSKKAVRNRLQNGRSITSGASWLN